jgi:hypothetical protein
MIPRKISEIVAEAAEMPYKEDKIARLRAYDHPALRGYLRMALDPNMKMALPEGRPPFKPSKVPDLESVLYREFRRMYIFFPGGNTNLKPGRREQLFITFLESLDPKEADFILDVVKAKKLPEGLDEATIWEAFPGL